MPVFQLRRVPQLLSPSRQSFGEAAVAPRQGETVVNPPMARGYPVSVSAKCASLLHSRAQDRPRGPGVHGPAATAPNVPLWVRKP